MVVFVLIVAGLFTWAGATLLLDTWWKRWDRPDLAEQLGVDQPDSVADEARRWLESN
jgi:hypothetical protein